MEFKSETVISAALIIAMATVGWSINIHFSRTDKDIYILYEKLDQIELIICSKHNEICTDLK